MNTQFMNPAKVIIVCSVVVIITNIIACTTTASQMILQEALEKGYVDCHIWKVLVSGAAGSGKTSLKYHLFGKELPSVRCSTALAEAAI